MEEKTFTVHSHFDDLRLDGVLVLPDGKPKGIVQIVHGMVEYKERYLDFMRFLADHGYVCVAHDHRGHGKSVKNLEDWGYFGDDKGEAIVEDVNDIQNYVRNLYPDLPVALFGHSMGSLVVRKYIKKYDDRIHKLIVCGAVGNNALAGTALTLCEVLSKFKGDRYRSKTISDLATGNNDKKFEGDLKNRWISANEENVRTYNDTAACTFTFTLNGFKNLFHLVQDTYDKQGWNVKNPDLEILFVAGKDDPVIISQEKWQQAQDFLKQQGYKHVTGKLYEDMRHEILNELDHNIVYLDILEFLEG
jgi:alpha-beta hydrolase superfamily lysophospholipase